MDEPRPVHDYLQLGMSLWFLLNPEHATPNAYEGEVDSFAARLKLCGMPVTLHASNVLQRSAVPVDARTGRIAYVATQQLKSMMQTIRQTLEGESIQQKTIVLDIAGVSARLRKAATDLTWTATQINLLQETVLAVECGAYRSAVVMGWNMAYDYVRQWLFDNRLNEFNAHLTSNYLDKKSRPVYEPIAAYDDFLKRDAPGEKVVLKSMRGADIIGEVVYEHLSQHLRHRNEYAHSKTKALSRDQANAYIEHLLGLISDLPFPPPSAPATPPASP
jgi:hypothetical protein